MPQSGTTEEVMGDIIQQDTKSLRLRKEDTDTAETSEEGWEGLIQG